MAAKRYLVLLKAVFIMPSTDIPQHALVDRVVSDLKQHGKSQSEFYLWRLTDSTKEVSGLLFFSNAL